MGENGNACVSSCLIIISVFVLFVFVFSPSVRPDITVLVDWA